MVPDSTRELHEEPISMNLLIPFPPLSKGSPAPPAAANDEPHALESKLVIIMQPLVLDFHFFYIQKGSKHSHCGIKQLAWQDLFLASYSIFFLSEFSVGL